MGQVDARPPVDDQRHHAGQHRERVEVGARQPDDEVKRIRVQLPMRRQLGCEVGFGARRRCRAVDEQAGDCLKGCCAGELGRVTASVVVPAFLAKDCADRRVGHNQALQPRRGDRSCGDDVVAHGSERRCREIY